MEKLTLQQVFNTIWSNVATGKMNTQNRDGNDRNRLSYEHLPFGCFIGMVLPKDLARLAQIETVEREIYAISNFYDELREVDVIKEVCEILPDDCVEALRDLQSIHDQYEPKNWKDCLVMFAGQYDLTIPEVSE